MDMSRDEPAVYVPMQEQTDAIKYADIQPSPYESPYQQDIYQEQGSVDISCIENLQNCEEFRTSKYRKQNKKL